MNCDNCGQEIEEDRAPAEIADHPDFDDAQFCAPGCKWDFIDGHAADAEAHRARSTEWAPPTGNTRKGQDDGQDERNGFGGCARSKSTVQHAGRYDLFDNSVQMRIMGSDGEGMGPPGNT